MIFDLDEKGDDIIRLRCPNCGSRKPIIVTDNGDYSVIFPACGAHEKLTRSGQIHVIVECRVRRRRT